MLYSNNALTTFYNFTYYILILDLGFLDIELIASFFTRCVCHCGHKR